MRWSGWFLGLISALLLGLVFVYSGGSLASAESEMEILPAVYDLREMDYPFPIIDQEACQMGYALAGTEMFQAALWQKENLPLMFSANQAKECTWWELTMDGNPCLEGELIDVINVFSTAGAVPDGCNPLYPGDGLCVEGCEPLYYLTGWQRLSTYQIVSAETIKQVLINYGPVYTKINTSLTGFESYVGNGVLYDPTNFTEVNHAVLIVGWDDSLNHAGGSGAWIVKNSYGTNWGDDGYGYIAYGSGGIGKESSVITDWIKNNPNENLYFYDAAGFTQQMTLALNDLDGYMMVLYTTQRAELIQQIELWTTDAATVSIWVYDRFTNGQVVDPILSIPEVSIPSAGYHHIPVLIPVELGAYDEIAVVAYIHNNTNMFPYALDTKSPYQVGKNWYSDDGVEWITFDPEGFSANFGLRLRTTLPPPPSQPLGFTITNKSQTALRMTWQPVEDEIHGYLLERRNPVTLLWERIAEVSPLVTAYRDAELVADTRYEYRLYAYNLGGLSAPSELSTRTLPYAPAAPTDLKISVLSVTKVKIEWTDQSSNESGFRIERQRTGEDWMEIKETDANIQAWMDETVLGETTYRYRIFAINAGGDSLPVVSDEIRTLNWPYKIVLPIILH